MASRYARCHNLSASRFLSRSHPVFIEENAVFPETAAQRSVFFRAEKNDTIPGGRSPFIGHVKRLILDLNPDFFIYPTRASHAGKLNLLSVQLDGPFPWFLFG